MSQSGYIALLDPSLMDKSGTLSSNLGDVIIYGSVREVMEEMFPGTEIIRIPTHQPFGSKEKKIINGSLFSIVGGTNILTSKIRDFSRLIPYQRKGFYIFPGFGKIILLGTGWSAFVTKHDFATKFYYKRILNKKIFHSVRDMHSFNNLKAMGIENVLHTSCPTTWKINTSFNNRFNPSYNSVLFMLTDYNKDIENDEALIKKILSLNQDKIYFFPQGLKDTQYLHSLPIYKQNKNKFSILKHEVSDFYNLINSIKFNYIGTRLHGGIKCLQHENPSLIIAIDYRIREMSKSINLAITERSDINRITEWASGSFVPGSLNLPVENIRIWKEQFNLKINK